MLLAIDIGNTQTVFAVIDGEDEVCGQWRMATDTKRTSDEYAVTLLQLMEHQGLAAGHIDKAIMSSVVPEAEFPLRILCRRYFKVELQYVGQGSLLPPVEVKIERPAELGADRLINAYAAIEKYGAPLIIIDFGTATTFDVVNIDGVYVGGVIAPGVQLSIDALRKAAAKLPGIAVLQPEKVVGVDTVSAMQSGMYFGYLGLIEGIIQRIEQEHATKMQVVATGGLAALYAESTDRIHHVDSDLTVYGLQLLAKID